MVVARLSWLLGDEGEPVSIRKDTYKWIIEATQ